MTSDNDDQVREVHEMADAEAKGRRATTAGVGPQSARLAFILRDIEVLEWRNIPLSAPERACVMVGLLPFISAHSPDPVVMQASAGAARRIVAALNAVRGVPTERLESLIASDYTLILILDLMDRAKAAWDSGEPVGAVDHTDMVSVAETKTTQL